MARAVRVVPLLIGGGLALGLLALLLLRAREPVYLLTPKLLAVGVGAGVLGVAAAVAGIAMGGTRVTVTGFLLATCAAWGFLLTFEGGLLLVAAAIIAAAVALSRIRYQRGRTLVRAGLGVALAVSLSCLGLFALHGPAVDCSTNGPTISTWSLGFGSYSGSGGGSSPVKGVWSGWLTVGTTTYEFSCAAGHLMSFGQTS